MINKNKKTNHVDPIPQEFNTYEAAVLEGAELHNRIFEVEIDEDVAVALSQQAKKEGISIKSLVSQLLRQQLPPAA